MVGCYSPVLAQSAIKIETNSEQLFAVNLNQHGFINSENGSLTITNINVGSQQLSIAINDSVVLSKSIFTLANTLHTFRLKQLGNQWRLSIYAEEPLPTTTLINTTENDLVVAMDTANTLREVLLDSNLVTGCDSLSSRERVNKLKDLLAVTIFESKRLEILQDSLPLYCISTQQFALLLSTLDYEENKVTIIKNSFTQIFDITQLNQLKEGLILQQSIDTFNAFLQSDSYQQYVKQKTKS